MRCQPESWPSITGRQKTHLLSHKPSLHPSLSPARQLTTEVKTVINHEVDDGSNPDSTQSFCNKLSAPKATAIAAIRTEPRIRQSLQQRHWFTDVRMQLSFFSGTHVHSGLHSLLSVLVIRCSAHAQAPHGQSSLTAGSSITQAARPHAPGPPAWASANDTGPRPGTGGTSASLAGCIRSTIC